MGVKVVPADGCREITVGGRQYRPDRHGVIDVENKHHARKMVAEGGAFITGTSLAGSRVASYRCEPCEFTTVFTTCGRCGRPTVKEP